ncbi:MAG TPA: DUF2251 domain-containing protein [Puia sp.]|jgi:hypothetical protein|nr:DUF2251 domain-containing protein [Puia sp.]
MNGFLMQEKTFKKGEFIFIESYSPENNFGVIFEDDRETAYFYAVEVEQEKKGNRILDALHIYETDDSSLESKTSSLVILWSKDWLKSALVLDGLCHAVYDFEKQAGYNINEFPPPNSFWSKHERKLTNSLIQELF